MFEKELILNDSKLLKLTRKSKRVWRFLAGETAVFFYKPCQIEIKALIETAIFMNVTLNSVKEMCAYESNVGRSLATAGHGRVQLGAALVEQLELVHVCVAVELGGHCVLVTVDYMVKIPK